MLVVEENYVSGVPQTAIASFVPTGVAWHWTAGGTGRAGAQSTVSHFVSTRYTVNASYHLMLWWEAATKRTYAQWIVPPTKAAHSMNPAKALVPSTGSARENTRFTECRRILGAKAADPNAGNIAVSFCGMPADLIAAMKDLVFVADVKELTRQLIARPSVIDRPHFGHGWIQPTTRYETDTTTGGADILIARLYEAPEEDMPTPELVYVPELWKAGSGGTDLRRQPVMVTGNKVGLVPPGTFIYTVAETKDGVWRLGVADDASDRDGEGLFWMVRGAMTPLATGRDPELRAGIAAVVNARIAGKPVPTGDDCGDELAAAEQLTRAVVNQEWREWLATAPAAPSS